MFQKPIRKLCSFKSPGTDVVNTPWDYQHRAQIDFCFTTKRWRNACTNAETDTLAITNSDHFPLWITLLVKFAKPKLTDKVTAWDRSPNPSQLAAYNHDVAAALESPQHLCERNTIEKSITAAARNNLHELDPAVRRPWISAGTFELIKHKTQIRTCQQNR